MKPTNRSNYLIVLGVIACSVILLSALTFALFGVQWKQGGRTLEIDFKASTGIKLHSPVRYAGAPAGVVAGIRFLTPEERQKAPEPRNTIRVTVRLNTDVPVIGSDITAELASETILGEKFILLSPGLPDAAPMRAGSVIQGEDSIGFEAVARSAQTAIENLNEIIEKLGKDYPDLVPRLGEVIEQANTLLEQGTEFINNAGGALTNASEVVAQFKTDYAALIAQLTSLLDKGKQVATNADLTIQRVGSLAGRADTLIKSNEQELHELLTELRVVSQNLKVVSTYAKALTGALGQKPSRLIWRGKKTSLPTEEEILQSKEPIPVELPAK